MPLIQHFSQFRHSLALLALLAFSIASLSGCATRNVRTSIVNEFSTSVDLIREVKGLRTQPRDFAHPAIISVPRLKHILAAIEIETQSKGKKRGTTTIRRPAFHPEIIEQAATALARGLAEANPNQEVGVRIIRRQAVAGVFNKKYLTSFLAYVHAEYLYLTLRHSDWFVARKIVEANLPKPRRDIRPMKFRIVSGEPLYYAGPQTLEIDWRNDVFRSPFQLPDSTRGATRRREILFDSPIPIAEREKANSQSGDLSIGDLSPAQLRALADLEDDRRQGVITETAYQRAKRQLLRRR
jgi:hypothetical protein